MNYHYSEDRKTVFFDTFKCRGFYFNLCFIFELRNDNKYHFCGITTKNFIRKNFIGE